MNHQFQVSDEEDGSEEEEEEEEEVFKENDIGNIKVTTKTSRCHSHSAKSQKNGLISQ